MSFLSPHHLGDPARHLFDFHTLHVFFPNSLLLYIIEKKLITSAFVLRNGWIHQNELEDMFLLNFLYQQIKSLLTV